MPKSSRWWTIVSVLILAFLILTAICTTKKSRGQENSKLIVTDATELDSTVFNPIEIIEWSANPIGVLGDRNIDYEILSAEYRVEYFTGRNYNIFSVDSLALTIQITSKFVDGQNLITSKQIIRRVVAYNQDDGYTEIKSQRIY